MPPADTQTRNICIVLAAHGSTRRPDANATIEAHARQMRAEGPFRQVEAAFLLGDTAPADIAANIDADTVVIVPFMMSDGYLADAISAKLKEALCERPGTTDIVVTAPVGTHEAVASIARDKAEQALTSAGIDAAGATLVLVAHGSGGRPESKAAGEVHANRLAQAGGFGHVLLATLEEAPFLDDVLAGIDGPAAVVGLFAAPGGHAIDDIRAAVARQNRSDIVDAGPVGTDPAMTAIAVMRARAALES
ncbi:MAG: hypothetical protein JJ900_08580 [Rhodospirillales bacterium]|nr:hypothetical protein [Rhodospirillales bacterium]MBO6786893.1 hypothetical protein [Rhodospirillales bacterium]